MSSASPQMTTPKLSAITFQKVPLTARPLRKFMHAATQFLNDGIATHVKAYIGNIGTLQGTTPTHSVAWQSTAVNPMTLPKFIKDGTITPTILYCVTRKSDGSVPSLEAIQRFGSYQETFVIQKLFKPYKRNQKGLDSWPRGCCPLTLNGCSQTPLLLWKYR